MFFNIDHIKDTFAHLKEITVYSYCCEAPERLPDYENIRK